MPRDVVIDRTARRAIRSGVMWGYVFGLFVASSSLGFASTYKTPAQRERLAGLFGNNPGINALVGPARHIDQVAGFTAWRCLIWLNMLGAVWALLLSTRSLRGEEESGRWELMLAGATTARRATGRALVGLAAGLGGLFAVTAVVTIVCGRSSKVHFSVAASLFFAATLVAGAVVFMAVGALTSQLAATRRAAASYAAGALGVCFAIRLVADSGTGMSGLRWLTPIGWVEECQPLVSPRAGPLLLTAALAGLLAAAAVYLAGRRDLGASILPDRSSRPARNRLMFGTLGLAVRLSRSTLAGWAVGITGLTVLMGLIAKDAGRALASSSAIQKVVARLGARGTSAYAYLGLAFLIVAVLIALLAAGQVSATRAEEGDGRLDNLLVRPVSRSRWLGERVALAGSAALAAGVLAGLTAWLGAATQDSGVALGRAMTAGVNLVPPALCLLGLGVLGLGLWPRRASEVMYGVLAWSLLIEVVGGSLASNHWVLDTSVFHQRAAAPAVPVDWVSASVMAGVGFAAAVVGVLAFARRDLAGG